MKLAILQSNYLPWKGYFDIIHDVDLFLFYDEVQYTTRDWRNRNKIMTLQGGQQWLSVPTNGTREMRIMDVKISDSRWGRQHYNAIAANYSRAPYFKKYKDFLADFLLDRHWESLSELNHYLIVEISRRFLGVKTEFGDTLDYASAGAKHEKLLNIVKASGADIYLSGPAAKDYIHGEDYAAAGIELRWKDYGGYPEYKQLARPFCHNVSVIDLLMNTGDDAPYYIWGWREAEGRPGYTL